MNTLDADIIVVGGGCAGLSLGMRLAAMGLHAPRTLIVEPRTHYTNDRTWSGWRTAPHPFLDCVRASWSRWAISSGGQAIVRGHDTMVYDTIPADRFYDKALSAIADSPNVSILGGAAVSACSAGANAAGVANVETDAGLLRARLVIDTRPPAAGAAKGGLLQSFAGLEVETDRPCFTPDTVGLMAFDAPAADAITFLYTLPFSPTRALLELTTMSPGDVPPPSMQALHAQLQDRLGVPFTTIRTETGCLPMRPFRKPRTMPRTLLQLGSPAGALRASTGYGFANIQMQTDALAHVLRGGAAAALGWQPPRPPAWMRGMDRLFLRVLHRHPETGPGMLTTLFRRCPSASLVRFLGGTGGLLDGGRVVLSMPKIPFLRDLAWLT